jgi:anti-sigma factor RsiW
MTTMKCEDAYRFICDNLDAKMDSPRCRQIKQHLASCPECRRYLRSLRTTVALYRKEPSPHVPTAVHRNLLALVSASGSAHHKAKPHRSR